MTIIEGDEMFWDSEISEIFINLFLLDRAISVNAKTAYLPLVVSFI